MMIKKKYRQQTNNNLIKQNLESNEFKAFILGIKNKASKKFFKKKCIH